MSFVNSPEMLKIAIKEIFEIDYPTFQSAINARWNDGIELPEFKRIEYGDVNSPNEVKAWPTLAILSGDVFPVLTTEQRRDIKYSTRIYIRTFLRHANISILDKHLDRTLEAQMLMFEEDPYNTINHKASELRFLLAEPTATHNPAGSTNYIRALELQYEAIHR